MNDIASRIGPRPPPAALPARESTSTQAAAAPLNEAQSGLGPLTTRRVAVGSGQTMQRLLGTPGMLAGASPKLRALLGEPVPAGAAILRLKERQLGHGDAQDSAYLRDADRAIRRLLSGTA